MAAPIDAFVAGQYYCFYGQPNLDFLNFPRYLATSTTALLDTGAGMVPSWVGITRTGFTLTTVSVAELVEGDVLGGSVIDLIYRGGNVWLAWDAISFRPGAVLPSWPWGLIGNVGTIGRLGSAVGGALYLAAAPLTPAVGVPAIGQVIINSLTARNAILADNFQANWLFDSRLRRIPIQMRLLPYLSGLFNLSTSAGRTNSPPSTFTTVRTIAPTPSIPVTTTGTSQGITEPPSTGGVSVGFGNIGSAGIRTDLGAFGTLGASPVGAAIGPTTLGIEGYISFPYYSWYVVV